MTVRCLECRHLGLKGFPKHANEGLGQCKPNAANGVFVSYLYRRECSQYERADEGVITKRLLWRDQLVMFRKVKK